MITNIWTKQLFQKLDNQQDGILSSNEIINTKAKTKTVLHNLKELAQIQDYQLMQQQDIQKSQVFKNSMNSRKNLKDVIICSRQN